MTRLPLRTPWGGGHWYIAQTGSTMDDARALEAQGEPSGTVIRTDHQVSGIGRFSTRPWTSAPGESLLFTGFWSMSVLGRPDFAPSLTVGWGVCSWLESLLGPEVPVALKWPNDVYVNDRKLGGILVRTRLGPTGPATLHVGIGINLTQNRFEGEFRTPPISLAMAGATLSPEAALEGLLPYLAQAMADSSPRSACEQRLWRRGQQLTLQLPGKAEAQSGRVLGLGSEGQLHWETGSGEAFVSAGE